MEIFNRLLLFFFCGLFYPLRILNSRHVPGFRHGDAKLVFAVNFQSYRLQKLVLDFFLVLKWLWQSSDMFGDDWQLQYAVTIGPKMRRDLQHIFDDQIKFF